MFKLYTCNCGKGKVKGPPGHPMDSIKHSTLARNLPICSDISLSGKFNLMVVPEEMSSGHKKQCNPSYSFSSE